MVKNKDKRYSIAKEWCGYSQQQYVVRFCGAFCGSFPTKEEAEYFVLRMRGNNNTEAGEENK